MREFFLNSGIYFEENVPLKKLTTFGTGGPARYVVQPKDEREISAVLTYLKQNDVPYFCLGGGSNVLASDDGFSGVVIVVGRFMSQIFFENGLLVAQAGAKAGQVAHFACINGLSGAEFLAGIPACMGGAAYMNAGCFDREMSDVVAGVKAADENGEKEFGHARCGFAYRKSVFQSNGMIVTRVLLALKPEEPEKIRAAMKEILEKKKLTQPLEYPSAGSIFRAEGGAPAGLLIDRAGLKGLRAGGAEISLKHANFIVNKGGATAKDILELMDAAGSAVKRKFGVVLRPEIKYLGDTDDIGRLSYSFTL